MNQQEQIELARAALEEIVETAKRDPNVDPEKIWQIARDALERLQKTRE